ncbi:hypothetical protein Tco_1102663 [Tanacetum coccineum]
MTGFRGRRGEEQRGTAHGGSSEESIIERTGSEKGRGRTRRLVGYGGAIGEEDVRGGAGLRTHTVSDLFDAIWCVLPGVARVALGGALFLSLRPESCGMARMEVCGWFLGCAGGGRDLTNGFKWGFKTRDLAGWRGFSGDTKAMFYVFVLELDVLLTSGS